MKRKHIPTFPKTNLLLFFEIRPKQWCKKGNSSNFQTPGKPSALFLRQELLVLGVKLPKEIGHLAFPNIQFSVANVANVKLREMTSPNRLFVVSQDASP